MVDLLGVQIRLTLIPTYFTFDQLISQQLNLTNWYINVIN